MTDTIRFDEDYLEEIARSIRKLSNSLQDASNDMSRLNVDDTGAGGLGTSFRCRLGSVGAVASGGNMSAAFRQSAICLSRLSDYAERLSQNVQIVSSRFVATENDLLRSMGVEVEEGFNIGSAVRAAGEAITDIGGAIVSGIGNIGKAIVDNWKTGASMIVGKLSEWKSALVKDWEEKGLSYRIVKGIGAAVEIVGGLATVVCAVAGTGITAGLGTPATVLIGTYGANTAISGFADLYNCIFGDVEKVGEVDLLKSMLKGVCGQTGKWLGNEKLGQSVGEAIYTVGGLTATVVSVTNLAGQIKQANSAAGTLKESWKSAKQMMSKASKEIPDALSGLGYIANNVSLRDIPYNLALMSKQIPNITSVIADAKLVSKGVSYGKKFIDAGVDIVNSFADYEMVQEPALIKTYEQAKKAMTFPGKTVDDMKENVGKIDDALSVFLIDIFSNS